MRHVPGMRVLGALVSACLLASVAPTSVVPVALADNAPGLITINDGSYFTDQRIVSIALPYPTDDDSLIRLSNNGTDWGTPIAWAPIVSWDLLDAASGGVDLDAEKFVYAQSDNGTGSWADVGSDTVVLDRLAPTMSGVNLLCNYTSGWIGEHACWGHAYDNDWEYSLSIDRLEFSLDGGPWINQADAPGYQFDFRTPMWGGSWEDQDRQVCVRAIDKAGNVGSPECRTYDLNIPPVIHRTDGDVYDIRIDMPLAPVTGQNFTLKPVFPDNFPAASELPDTAICDWILTWGDLDPVTKSIVVNENYGQIWMNHLFKRGGCGEWTFTLPYTPGLTYEYTFKMYGKWESNLYGYAQAWTGTMFQATVGTMERGIPHSTLGLAYILPDQYETRPGVPATYRLYKSDTPNFNLQAGWWWASNLQECGSLFGSDAATLSKTFTYTPDCQASWQTGWTWEDRTTREYLRAVFDPPADKTPPTVSAPTAVPMAASQISTTLPTRVSWSSLDPKVRTVSTGVTSNQLQMSRNGGKWKNVTLSSPKATSVLLNLSPSGSYRFRARATDSVGNRSAWSTGPVLKPRLLQQSAAALGSGWSSVSSTAFSGGSALRSGNGGVNATLTFTGRAISWVGTAGSGHGFAQIRIDGVLVQTIDLAAGSPGERRILFSRWLGAGTHTLKITGLGTFGRQNVTLDAFTVF